MKKLLPLQFTENNKPVACFFTGSWWINVDVNGLWYSICTIHEIAPVHGNTREELLENIEKVRNEEIAKKFQPEAPVKRDRFTTELSMVLSSHLGDANVEISLGRYGEAANRIHFCKYLVHHKLEDGHPIDPDAEYAAYTEFMEKKTKN